MMISLITRLLVLLLSVSGSFSCRQKTKPGGVAGIYEVTDAWRETSSYGSADDAYDFREIKDSGRVQYDLGIFPDGEEGLIFMNIHKTISGVKGILNDYGSFSVYEQVITIASGKTYVMHGWGKLEDNRLDMTFFYRSGSSGYALCQIEGLKTDQ
jgi:hypothetical protein